MMKKSNNKKGGEQALKRGSLTDEEKRKIEGAIDISSFADIGRALNRNPATIRKYCQRNALSNDLTSKKKYVDNRAKHNHHLVVMQEQTTKEEYDFAIQVYKGMMDQFGSDIVYSEEVQIIEYCMITCLLNRVLKREMEIDNSMKEQKKIRGEWQKKKDDIAIKSPSPTEDDDEDKEAEKYELEDYYLDKVEQIDLRIADLQTEYVQIKKNQMDLIDRKEKITKAIDGSREQRSKEIMKTNQNFADLIVSLKKNEEFRKNIGLEIERMRLAVREEYIRLSDLHLFADNVEDYPILNTEVIMREKENDEP